jgi:hypothetical protein
VNRPPPPWLVPAGIVAIAALLMIIIALVATGATGTAAVRPTVTVMALPAPTVTRTVQEGKQIAELKAELKDAKQQLVDTQTADRALIAEAKKWKDCTAALLTSVRYDTDAIRLGNLAAGFMAQAVDSAAFGDLAAVTQKERAATGVIQEESRKAASATNALPDPSMGCGQ